MVAAAAPSSHLVVSCCDAGERYQFETATCDIELRNTGDDPIKVSGAEARFPWDSIDTGTITVPGKGTSYLKARIDLRNDEGLVRRPFRFATDEPGQPYRGSEVRAYVESALDQSKPILDFGVVKLGPGDLPSVSISLSSREAKDFRITGIESKPPWLDVALNADGRTLRATLRDSVPWGLIHHGDAFVKVNIDTPKQHKAWVEVQAQVLGDVVPDGNPFQLGLLRTVGQHAFLIRLTSRSGKEFAVGNLAVERIKANAGIQPCVPASRGCKLVSLDVANDQPPGKLDGILKVELPGYGRTLPIELVGILVTPETKIHQMDELLKDAANSSGAMSSAAKPADLGSAIESTIRKQEPPPPGTGPLLRWSVAHQGLIYGYAIYRAESETGPFLRINDEIIRVVEEGADKSGAYQWRDNSAKPGKTYWYQIGILNRNGSKQDLTGVQKVVAK